MRTDWSTIVRSFRVSGAMPMSFSVTDNVLTAEMTVPDTMTDELITISNTWELPRLTEPQAMLLFLRSVVHWFYRHEADEQITVNGVRVYYPEQEHV